MTHFVFCHGFGFDRDYWRKIAPYFAQEKCSFWDLGYFNRPDFGGELPSSGVVGIGHSLGLAKLAERLPHCDLLIGLNGFSNFLGAEPNLHRLRLKELKALRLGFAKEFIKSLQGFYQGCGSAEFGQMVDFTKLNQSLILSEFDFLEREHSLPAVPTLILTSDRDYIVPAEITNDNFNHQSHVTVESIGGGGHGLGYNNPAEVYQKIIRFISDHRPS